VRKQLTDVGVRRLAPPTSGRLEIYDVIVPWMAVRVTPNGHKSFVARARIKGQQRPIRYTIGPVSLLTVADARQRARDALLKMQGGIDPREEKKAQAAAVERRKRTAFAAVAEAYIADHVAELRSGVRTARDIRRYLVAAWGNRPIESITADDLAELIQSIIAAGKPMMADRVLVYAKGLFKWAASPARPRDERLVVNPAANLTSRDFKIKQTERDVELSREHLRTIWTCSARLGEPWASYFKMLVLSGQRRMEIGGLRWTEIDFDERVIVFPASRMKAGRPHEVPLTGQMIELLRTVERGTGPYVFSVRDGQVPMGNFDRIKRRLDTLIEEQYPGLIHWTIHDIRRAVRTGLGAIPQVPHDVAELVVAHVPDRLTRTYNLHGYREEKRQALTLWSERLMRIVKQSPWATCQ
jgi:integrase